MLIVKNIWCNRIFLAHNAFRQSSSLPKALPNEDEVCEENKKRRFAPAKLTYEQIKLPKIIQITEKNIREAKLKKDWSQMKPNGLIKAYLQVKIVFLINFINILVIKTSLNYANYNNCCNWIFYFTI